MNEADKKNVKNCFIFFASKRAVDFSKIEKIINSFASRVYYFDKFARVAFDDSEEIVHAVKDGVESYENLVICCPSVMEKSLKDFISLLSGGVEFDGTGYLKNGNFSAFILLSDAESFLNADKISDIFDKKYSLNYERTFLKTVGAPQKNISEALNEAKSACGDMNFSVRESYGDCSIEVIYSVTTPKVAYDNAYRALLKKLNDYIYALEDISLAKRLVELLKLRRMKISVAESFTGGGIGKRLVDIPGVSAVYDEGLNTYSNESKSRRLGVNDEILRVYGAVSEETAAAMVEGLLSVGNCDVAISTTGIAGPASDNTRKPVGLIYIGVGIKEKVSVFKYNLKGDRETITQTAINLALFHAYKIIK